MTEATFTSDGQFEVPANVTSLTVTLEGEKGQPYDEFKEPGSGGTVKGELPVTPGETLHIRVGYGAGAGNASINNQDGGGAVDIRQGGDTLHDRAVVAGAGGGDQGSGSSGNFGGHGGGEVAHDGAPVRGGDGDSRDGHGG